jgi:uncharacterized protein
MRHTLVVAGVSARFMAEAAQRDGYRVIALDVFGDVDTRRASVRWQSIGDPSRLAIDPEAVIAALDDAAREPGVIGWVAGPGFEAHAQRLEHAAVPRLGTPAAQVARVRHAPTFFAALDALALPHPPVQFEPPAAAHGWLAKDAHGSGGWHIHDAGTLSHLSPTQYFQREVAGVPMSLLFVADGQRAHAVGMNRLIVAPHGRHRFVYQGAVGGLPPEARIVAAADSITRAFGLRGLASLDFIADGGQAWLLEVNPRASASMALYPEWPLMRAHVLACGGEPLPELPCVPATTVRGTQILFARTAVRIDDALSRQLAAMADCHDVPMPATAFAAGDPVCSVSAAGSSVDDVQRRLAARLHDIEHLLTIHGAAP